MKQYKSIFSSCLAVLFGACLFTGCATDEMIKGEEEQATEKPLLTIVAGVSEAAGTRADDPLTDLRNENGSWIMNMTIFLFAPNAGDDSKPLLVKTAQTAGRITQSNQIKSIELTGKELGDANIALGTRVDIYAITNHIPPNAAGLTKKEVMELTATTPGYIVTAGYFSFIPMSGTALNHTITSEANHQTTITLHRTILRVKITVVDAEFNQEKYNSGQYKWGILTIKLYNDYSTTYLWNKGIPITPDLRNEGQAIMKDLTIAYDGMNGWPNVEKYFLNRYYLSSNETSDANPQPANKITVKLIGSRIVGGIPTPFEYTIELKRPDGTYNFERNTALNVTITIKAKGYATNVEVVPWDVDTESPEIDPVGIRFVDTDTPLTVIPKSGTLAAIFNFDNPADIHFTLYMCEGDTHTGTQLNTFNPDASLQQVTVAQLAENTSGAIRKVSFWYQSDNGVWVDTGVRAEQQAS